MPNFNDEFENQTSQNVTNEIPEQPQVESTPTQKRKRKWLLSATILIALCAVVSVFLAPTMANAFAKLTMSPTKYYQKIEKSNQDEQIDKLSKSYGEYLKTYKEYMKNGIGSNMSISTDIDSSITRLAGLEGLESVKISIDSMVKELITQSNLAFFCNGEEFTNLSLLMDMKKQEGYYLIPDLNEAYLKLSYANLYEDELTSYSPTEVYRFLEEGTLSEKLLNNLSKKYLHLVIDELDQVKKTKDDIVTADGITQSYMKLTVNIDAKKALEISKSVLTSAQSDQELEDLLVDLKVFSKEEYQNKITSSLEELDAKLESIPAVDDNTEDTFIMSIWVDNKGNIMGREFTDESETTPSYMGYQKVIDGNKIGINAWVSENSIDIINIHGTLVLKASGASGDINATMNLIDAEPFQLTMKMENGKYKYKDGYASMNGDFTFTSENSSAIKVNVKSTGVDKQQTILVEIIQGEVTLATINLDSSVTGYKAFQMPLDSAKTYDLETEMEQYIESSDLTGFLENINDKIKIESINQVIDNLILYSTY